MHPLFARADKLSGEVIGAAIEVHRIMGPGLLESIYERCLLRELELLKRVRVIVALGRLAFDAALASVGFDEAPKRRPAFGHGAECKLSQGIILIASFHPSQQNTFTGRLTEPMFDRVFSRAREIIDAGE